ncbi:Uncharacterised protein [Mycobacteroides abscessus subsp. abscessus]|nr:Uncharacterised protein [Mycobacteroides abscessus subsp. abscessus]
MQFTGQTATQLASLQQARVIKCVIEIHIPQAASCVLARVLVRQR